MRLKTFVGYMFDRAFRQPAPLFRYLMPFANILVTLAVQFAIAALVPKRVDFPYVLLYLLAIFATAWFGGYIPGAIACLITMVGIPMLATPGFRLTSVDSTRLGLLTGVSCLVSLVAQSGRKKRELLRKANAELDKRVNVRTRELAVAVEHLELEIAQHKRTEDALRRSERRVDFALDAAGIGRWDVDLASGRVDQSDTHTRIFGEDSGPTSRENLFDRVAPEDRAAVEQSFRTAIETGGFCEFECRIQAPDGGIRWVWGRGRALRDESGTAVSFLGSSRDITEHKVIEQRLRTQLERMNLLGRITRAIAERQDLYSLYQVVIRTLEEELPVDLGCVCVYDAPKEEVVVTCVGVHSGALAMDLAMSEEAHISVDQNGLSRCVRGELVYEPDVSMVDFPFPQRLARGGLRALVAAPLLVESRVFGVLIAARREAGGFSSSDCEFLKQLSEHVALAAHQAETHNALQQAYDDLRQTQMTVMQQERLRALGQMASGIGHDINNAISPISLYLEMLLGQETGLSDRAREYLETSQRAIGDVAHTVSRMREFYRQQETELTLASVDLGVLSRQVADLSRARWFDMPQQRGVVIDLRLDLAPSLPAVAGIESEIREALTNLVFNAVDAMPGGGTLTIRTKAADNGTRLVDVEVSDTGIGMNEETRRRCLEPFFTTKGERGTGLGLAMVYGVARRHNAEIEVESEVGRGTTMRLRFAGFGGVAAEGEQATESAVQRLRILNVDDDPLLTRSLRDVLEADGHVVVSAGGGQEGIDAFRKAAESDEPFAVVITDLGMPYVDGRKVANAVKSESPSTPVVLLTGWGQRLVAEGDVPPNVDRVLNKPPRLRELRAALAELAGSASRIRTSVAVRER